MSWLLYTSPEYEEEVINNLIDTFSLSKSDSMNLADTIIQASEVIVDAVSYTHLIQRKQQVINDPMN